MSYPNVGWCTEKWLRHDDTIKKSYLWLCRNTACVELPGSIRIEKIRVCVPPGLVWGKAVM